MKALDQLKALGYEAHLDGDELRLVYRGQGKPDSKKVVPLLETLKQHKREAVLVLRLEALKGKCILDECEAASYRELVLWCADQEKAVYDLVKCPHGKWFKVNGWPERGTVH